MEEIIRVLILEDVPLDAELIIRELKKEGFEFESHLVERKEDYIREVQEWQPHIILADHSLPQFDGVTALHIAQEKSPHTPFIFVSGKIGEEFAVEMLKKGATDYVLKHNLSKLGYAVQRALKELKEQLEKKKAEEALLESEEKYRLMVENQTDMVVKFDPEGDILFASPSFCEVLGRTEEMIVGSNFLPLVHQDDQKKTLRALDKLNNPPYVSFLEHRLLTMNGWRWISWANKALLDDDGNLKAFVGVGRDITERKLAEDRIMRSLQEKELLLREVHHRVKNNLQIVSTLLSLQSSEIDDNHMKNLYRESQNRITSISLIHENLYQSEDLTNINFQNYVKNLIDDLFHSFGVDPEKIKINIKINNIIMGMETAIPCGLIINEMISNILKHAFPHGEGNIDLELSEKNKDKYIMRIKDDGKPFPKDFKIGNTNTLGIKLIKSLVMQLNGEMTMNEENKEFLIEFDELKYKERI
ncbi:MAG: histidine kinase dimerization/phosphoacceptor domain -containing protein [Euryarchaeota archaeon]|jgi:two-component system sensor kinase|uniref:histidine kinase dimerization/phosphoacceptor domain -containing protein n=1 Tax=Methanobacterium sp. MZD130B TaxID=3394378 RepID=UPI001767F9A4|nr:histidine kinase dimerization/phosphoacceptor domain -containing protein [Euryarchaeota archaeon]HHT18610.1 PAS domain S-box protein [Methanobacterium sp.]